jgi:hypothetical protein
MYMKRIVSIPALLLAVISVVLPFVAIAAGIQVSPSRLDVTVPAGRIAQRELVVANPTADVQLFTVYADEFEEYIKPNPASFTVEAGGRKTVIINIKGSDNGTLSTNISIVGKPLVDARLQTNTGVKIPITIVVGKWKPKPWQITIVGTTLMVLISWSVYVIRRRKQIR